MKGLAHSLFLIFCFIISNTSFSQHSKLEDSIRINRNYDDTIVFYEITEILPEFPGGQAKLYEFLNQNLKHHQEAINTGIQGKMYVKFAVMKDGSIDDIHIIKGDNSSLNKEIVRVLESMPKWNPGMINDKPVNTYFTIPIHIHWE